MLVQAISTPHIPLQVSIAYRRPDGTKGVRVFSKKVFDLLRVCFCLRVYAHAYNLILRVFAFFSLFIRKYSSLWHRRVRKRKRTATCQCAACTVCRARPRWPCREIIAARASSSFLCRDCCNGVCKGEKHWQTNIISIKALAGGIICMSIKSSPTAAGIAQVPDWLKLYILLSHANTAFSLRVQTDLQQEEYGEFISQCEDLNTTLQNLITSGFCSDARERVLLRMKVHTLV